VASAPGQQIATIGGGAGGAAWTMSAEDAIEAIEEGRLTFYVLVGGTASELVVASGPGGTYLKTEADLREPNHLLALIDCAGGEEQDD
jgi:hypothetical protein